MRLSATVPLLALGSVSLAAIGLPASSVGSGATAGSGSASAASCSHSGPISTAAQSKRLNQPTSGSDPRPLGEALAEGVTTAVSSIEPLDATGRPTSGLPYGLSQGIIGVLGSPTTGYKVILDESRADRAKYQAAIDRYVPAAGAKMLGTEPSCRTASAIAETWRAVGGRAWSADASRTTFTADLDPATEDVLVEYDLASTSPGALDGLRGIDGVRLVPGSPQRLSRLNDTPKGGHWGGARITSHAKNCSAGFSVVRRSDGRRGSVTAGHCGGPGTKWRSGKHYYGTTTVRTGYPDYDQALITGSTYGPKIWTNGPGDSATKRTVRGGGDPAIGASVCQSGSFSTSICGLTVRSTSARYCDPDGCTTHVIRATRGGSIAIIGGDSGGPVYTRPGRTTATIRGITFAGSGCASSRCTTLYAERYKSITGHLNVRALTG